MVDISIKVRRYLGIEFTNGDYNGGVEILGQLSLIISGVSRRNWSLLISSSTWEEKGGMPT